MSREWKPGDVAMVECSDGEWRRAGYRRPGIGNVEAWEFEDGSLRRVNESRTRPLVVIDPEDREAVERLMDAFTAATYSPVNSASLDDINSMQAALREFANPKPPKPEEPQGLGAVVEDADGNLWVRTDRAAPWSPIRGIGGHSATRRLWSEITAVRVLSPGVEVDQ